MARHSYALIGSRVSGERRDTVRNDHDVGVLKVRGNVAVRPRPEQGNVGECV